MRLLARLGIVLALGLASSVHAEEYTKSYSVTGRAEVHVRVDDSSVRIVTSDTHQVDFDVKHEGSTAGLIIGGKMKIDSQQNGNLVELTVLRKPGITVGFSDKELSTEVHMPRDADLQIETRDGRVDVAALNGTLTIHTTDGSVVVKASQGSKMSAAWNIKTVDGGIELARPHDFQANLDARTRDGHISLSLPVTVQGNIGKSEVHGTLNGGGPELTVRSTDGSIRINGI